MNVCVVTHDHLGGTTDPRAVRTLLPTPIPHKLQVTTLMINCIISIISTF